ncbi:putative DNA-binding domain-containing protein [Lutimaribacter marinistellae]|uniref:DNA-binding domain-containing protein n=1 Tax=Lutimaribacter marinistellae TaxID=1820329 RepID=A0ABV7TJ72_9RHOB
MSVSQREFHTALLAPEQPHPQGLRDGADRPAGRRFDVYRNNVAVSLTEALHDGFPVIAKLLGKQNLDGLAGIYLRQHPPASPLMMHFGAAFPAFLAGMPQLAHLGYLPDIARLELALRQSYHAGDAEPVPPQSLALSPEALMGATLGFAPSVQLLRSPWPIHDIWRFNTEPGAPKPRAAAQDVLVTRPEYDPLPRLLPPGGAEWITATQAGETLGTAQDRATSAAADFDLAALLAMLLGDGAITSLSPPKA